MAMGVTIQVTDPKEVENIKQREMDITKEMVLIIQIHVLRVIHKSDVR